MTLGAGVGTAIGLGLLKKKVIKAPLRFLPLVRWGGGVVSAGWWCRPLAQDQMATGLGLEVFYIVLRILKNVDRIRLAARIV